MHDFEDDIICPHCNYRFTDSYEYNDADESKITCPECCADFYLRVHSTITYSTERINCEEKNPPQEHDWDNTSIRKNEITQEKLDYWEKNCSPAAGGEPHNLWMRNCKNCDDVDYKKTDINDIANPFTNQMELKI